MMMIGEFKMQIKQTFLGKNANYAEG